MDFDYFEELLIQMDDDGDFECIEELVSDMGPYLGTWVERLSFDENPSFIALAREDFYAGLLYGRGFYSPREISNKLFNTMNCAESKVGISVDGDVSTYFDNNPYLDQYVDEIVRLGHCAARDNPQSSSLDSNLEALELRIYEITYTFLTTGYIFGLEESHKAQYECTEQHTTE